MKLTAPLKNTALALAGILALSVSCRDNDKEDGRFTAQNSQDISEEATIDAHFQDVDDMVGVSLNASTDDQYSGGRTATTITVQDSRFKCSGIVVTITPGSTSTKDKPLGVIMVDFGTAGCSDLQGNIRTGKLYFTYNGWRFQPGSTVLITPDNYTINGIKLTGLRTLTTLTGSTAAAPKFRAELTGGVATFADGSQATRESDITWSWIKGQGAGGVDDQLIIDQSSTASGTTRAGTSYTVSLDKALTYQRFCPIATAGIKRYVLDGSKNIVIDYGNGTCDSSVTVTINGTTVNLIID